MNTPITRLLLTLVAPLLLGLSTARSETGQPPNILVFLSDDMHWHHPGFNGGLADTPNLDQLAEQGTLLTQFYVHSVCSPTRAAFMTGRYPFRNGMEERSHGNDTAGMLLDERTLAEALNEAGYFTAIIGKWHLGNWYKQHLPMQRGFDYQYGLYGALVGYYLKARERFYDWHRNEQTLRQEGYTTDLIGEECVQLIRRNNFDKPVFLYIPFNAVHGPHDPPPQTEEKYLKRIRDKSPNNPYTGLKGIDAVKFAMLESMDTAIGRVLEAMREKGQMKNTLVVYFNDNGGIRTNTPYRGGKKENYEGGVRVPCIFSWPGHVPKAKKINELLHVTDLYPTLVNLAGGSLDQPLPLDGTDVWNVIIGKQPSQRTEVVYSLPGDFVDTGEVAIRRGSYKLVDDELYNIVDDPYEKQDLAPTSPEIVKVLRERINELVQQRRTPEEHKRVSDTIDKPLLVFGREENEDPPDWLAGYLKSLPPTKHEIKRAQQDDKPESE